MSGTLHVAWDDRLTGYDFGPGHPLAPVRVELTIELARAFGVLDAPGVTVAAPAPATDGEIALVHDRRYIEAVRQASGPDPGPVAGRFGLGTDDDPIFPGMHDASALVAGATLAAARAVWSGAASHGVNIAGGLHHAMRGHASGFCVYNDPAIAIAWLLSQGAERIGYVDIDVHHGDGVQAAFWDDPRVLTISLHEHPATLFPVTGRPAETGAPGAEGYAVNVALPAGTRDAGWLRAFHAVVPPLLRAFRPQVLVSQHGCDTHWMDPLANLALTIDAQRAAHAAIHRLAHEVAGGRWRIRAGPGGAADLGAPARRGRRPPARPRAADPARLAGLRRPAHQDSGPGVHDRAGAGDLAALRGGLGPGRAGRPGHHGHPPGGVPAARPGAAVGRPGGRAGRLRAAGAARPYARLARAHRLGPGHPGRHGAGHRAGLVPVMIYHFSQ